MTNCLINNEVTTITFATVIYDMILIVCSNISVSLKVKYANVQRAHSHTQTRTQEEKKVKKIKSVWNVGVKLSKHDVSFTLHMNGHLQCVK